MRSDFVRGKPLIVVQQLGKPPTETDPLYDGCLEMRMFIVGCDYYDRERDAPVGVIVRRRSDRRLFAAPDYRFCKNPSFEVLWLNERRQRETDAK